jgi:hypothetical protein
MLDYRNIARQYRNQEAPLPMDSVQDLKLGANPILLSYFMEEENPSRTELVGYLKDLSILYEYLQVVAPTGSEIRIPQLPGGLDYSASVEEVAAVLTIKTEFSAIGDEGMLIIGSGEERTYTFPNGQEFNYIHLTHEMSANAHILEHGYCMSHLKEIYLRDHSIQFMLALLDLAREDPTFSEYHEIMDDFEYIFPGIVLAHENSHINLDRSRVPKGDVLNQELTVDLMTKMFFDGMRIDSRHYELFHLLRMGSGDSGIDVSRLIVENGPCPALEEL